MTQYRYQLRSRTLSIEQADVESALERSGFQRTNATGRLIEYRSRVNGNYLYFRTTIGLTDYIRLVVHPDVDVSTLVAVPGVIANPRKPLQHGDHMTRFPKRKNMGKNEVHFGKALNVDAVYTLTPFAAAFHRL